MKLARIYLKPDATRWFDLPLADNQDLSHVLMAMQRHGLVMCAEFAIPSQSVHHLELINLGAAAPAQWMHPPGKAN